MKPAMNEEKLNFLKKEFIPLLQKMDPDTKPGWGKMNLQQMIEHFSGAVKIATGTLKFPGAVETNDGGKSYAFMMSEKPFKERTNNPFLSEEPYPVRNHTLNAAIGELQVALLEFFMSYEKDADKRVLNPFFGNLNYAEQVQLLYKHALHHLRQFGVIPLSRI
jgi:hypothetical protein